MSSVLVFLEIKNREGARSQPHQLGSDGRRPRARRKPRPASRSGRWSPTPATPSFEHIHGKRPRKVYAIDHPLLHAYTAGRLRAACAQLIEHAQAGLRRLSRTPTRCATSPRRLATRFNRC
jgi:hypothetical protein